MNVTTDDLLKVIGRQQVEIIALQGQLAKAHAAVARAEKEIARPPGEGEAATKG